MANKKALSNADNAFLEEHLEKSSPLIIEEVRRWRDLLWDDYLDYQYAQKRSKKLVTPAAIHRPDYNDTSFIIERLHS